MTARTATCAVAATMALVLLQLVELACGTTFSYVTSSIIVRYGTSFSDVTSSSYACGAEYAACHEDFTCDDCDSWDSTEGYTICDSVIATCDDGLAYACCLLQYEDAACAGNELLIALHECDVAYTLGTSCDIDLSACSLATGSVTSSTGTTGSLTSGTTGYSGTTRSVTSGTTAGSDPSSTTAGSVTSGATGSDTGGAAGSDTTQSRGLTTSSTSDVCPTEYAACVGDATCVDCVILDPNEGSAGSCDTWVSCDEALTVACCVLENEDPACASNELLRALYECQVSDFLGISCDMDLSACSLATGSDPSSTTGSVTSGTTGSDTGGATGSDSRDIEGSNTSDASDSSDTEGSDTTESRGLSITDSSEACPTEKAACIGDATCVDCAISDATCDEVVATCDDALDSVCCFLENEDSACASNELLVALFECQATAALGTYCPIDLSECSFDSDDADEFGDVGAGVFATPYSLVTGAAAATAGFVVAAFGFVM